MWIKYFHLSTFSIPSLCFASFLFFKCETAAMLKVIILVWRGAAACSSGFRRLGSRYWAWFWKLKHELNQSLWTNSGRTPCKRCLTLSSSYSHLEDGNMIPAILRLSLTINYIQKASVPAFSASSLSIGNRRNGSHSCGVCKHRLQVWRQGSDWYQGGGTATRHGTAASRDNPDTSVFTRAANDPPVFTIMEISWLKVPTSAFTALDMKWGRNGQWS